MLPNDLGINCPEQPKYDFPKVNFRSFRAEWYILFPWLEYSRKLDRAFCFVCRNFLPSNLERADDVFIKIGYKNWKRALEDERGMKKHDSCNTHKKVSAKLF